eukprot:CAMPEP_0168467656 /NCGR_PEP_ID=MMETSP0228-20121227/57297_1 /TAXON_ID=133427 /ORGANISM="Protoceratium reticulatum, Strain CCCM 535 (=CCMP 1889)" /LENGTH=77 /DNA_ID=CAMNT_0008483377 /DNA_START=21 /DNA_END=251 /DNA_ORIENTATION=+
MQPAFQRWPAEAVEPIPQPRVRNSISMPAQASSCAQAIMCALESDDAEAADEHIREMISGLQRTSLKAFYHSLIHAC